MGFWSCRVLGGGDGRGLGHPATGQQEPATVQNRPLDRLAFGEIQGVGDGRREVHIPLLGAPALNQLDCCRIWHVENISMLNHRYKRILLRMLFAVEMASICPEAPSGCQNPGEFPKGINPKPTKPCQKPRPTTSGRHSPVIGIVSKQMRGDSFFDERRTFHSSRHNMFLHEVLNSIRAEPSARQTRERTFHWPRFLHPGLQHSACYFC